MDPSKGLFLLLFIHVYFATSQSYEGSDILRGHETIKTKLERQGFTSNNAPGPSSACRVSLAIFRNGLDGGDEWARKMYDSWGKPGSRVLEGNTDWLGAYDECHSVHPPSTDNRKPSFAPKFCLLSATFNTTVKRNLEVKVGVCFPDSCSADGIPALAAVLKRTYSQEKYHFTDATCEELSKAWDVPAICMLVILGLIGLLILVGTVYDLISLQMKLSNKEEPGSPEKEGEGIELLRDHRLDQGQDKENILYGTLDKSRGGIAMDEAEANLILAAERENKSHEKRILNNVEEKESIFKSLILSFSLYTNAKNVLSVTTGKSEITCIHGMRAISATWIVLGHFTFLWGGTGSGSLRNKTALTNYTQNFLFQVIPRAYPAVATFFVLSSVLLASSLLRDFKKKNGPKGVSWPKFFLLRFLRLTPSYMLLLGINAFLSKYLGNGPLWPKEGLFPECHTNWWKNLLYINNLYIDNRCMMHSWYLSVDMQLFIVSPLIVIPYYFHLKAGAIVSMLIILVSTVTMAVISLVNNFPTDGITVLIIPGSSDFDWEKWKFLIDDVPWTHISSYVIGIALGVFLYRTERILMLRRPYQALGWILAAGTNIAVVYGLYGGGPGRIGSAIYNSLFGTAWSLGVAWVILSCATGHGGPVNWILSWPIWIPLSRMSYMIYLVQLSIIEWYFLSRRTPMDWDDGNFVFLSLATVMISCVAAFVLTLTIEMPWQLVVKHLLK